MASLIAFLKSLKEPLWAFDPALVEAHFSFSIPEKGPFPAFLWKQKEKMSSQWQGQEPHKGFIRDI